MSEVWVLEVINGNGYGYLWLGVMWGVEFELYDDDD